MNKEQLMVNCLRLLSRRHTQSPELVRAQCIVCELKNENVGTVLLFFLLKLQAPVVDC